ncbi:hypothetical protein D8S78_14300 [Natrialba swarupiae]|nr:hypothetical protein [Natrialba swarupiae]
MRTVTHENDGHSHGDGHGRAEADGEIAHARSIQAIDLIDSETDERVADARRPLARWPTRGRRQRLANARGNRRGRRRRNDRSLDG